MKRKVLSPTPEEAATMAQNDQRTLSPLMEDIRHAIFSKIPILWVVTHEERRFTQELYQDLLVDLERELWLWSSNSGLYPYAPQLDAASITPKATGEMEQTRNPSQMLEQIEATTARRPATASVFVLRDFHTVLTPIVARQLRDMYNTLVLTRKTLIVVSPCVAYGPGGSTIGLEPTLESCIRVLDYRPPTRERLEAMLEGIVADIKLQQEKLKTTIVDVNFTADDIRIFSRALQGMTLHEAAHAVRLSLSKLGTIDVNRLLQEKKQSIKKSEALEYLDVKPQMSDVGGLDELKKFFNLYGQQFSDDARAFGLEPLKAVLLVGCPGTGKSLSAKAVASLWNLPLIRLDVGRVMGSLVGQSESNMRNAIRVIESVAPAVLWIDEVEKGLSGTASSNQSDSGTTARVFGTLLTAMEEGLKDIIVLATANDISQLPPELIRRFNEVFFFDLPVPQEREEILKIHLLKRQRDPEVLDLDSVIDVSQDYTGSELEKAVKEAIARSWMDGRRGLTTEDILGALQDTKPISKVMAERIKALRDWAKGRARFASSLALRAQRGYSEESSAVTTPSGRTYKIGLDDILS